MTLKTNFHTHTSFCDGKNSTEEMVIGAIKKGFTHLGFSSHCIYPYSSDWHIDIEKINDYKNEIYELKEKYKNDIQLFFGFEADYLPVISKPSKELYNDINPEYLIGSVHMVSNGSKGSFAVDAFSEIKPGLKKLFDNDIEYFVTSYFKTQMEMISTCDFDIIGHIDLIRRHNAKLKLFTENEFWYKRLLEETASVIAASNKIVEINTGGMARNDIDTPYPSLHFLRLLKEYDVPVIINSDAHNVEMLDYGFDIAMQTAKKAGYTESFMEETIYRFLFSSLLLQSTHKTT